jgi:hypothetical protein
MQNTEPATGQDVAGQPSAAHRRGRRLAALRVNSLGICVMLIAQMILGAWVNLYVRVPATDQGHGLATALGRALTNQPATFAAHAALGTLLLVAGLSVLTRAIRARHKLAIGASGTGLAAITGAAASGASFVNDSRAGASMAMAALTGAALLCYLAIMFAVRRPAATSETGHG